MDNENEYAQEEVVEQEEQTPEVQQEDTVVLSKADYTRLNRKAIAYDTVKKNPPVPINKDENQQINSVDLIKLGKKLQDFSDEELDFATDMAKSKKPEDILKALENPFVQAGIQANREKVEKEKLALRPSGTQPDYDAPMSLEEKLANASPSEQEAILKEMGLYSEPTRRSDGPVIRV